MNDVLTLVKKLKDDIDSYPLVKEYLLVKEEYLNDSFLNERRKLLCSLNKEKDKNFKRIKELKKEMDEYPLSINFNSLKEETYNFLKEVLENLSI